MTVQDIEQVIKLCRANGITRFKSKEIQLRFDGSGTIPIETRNSVYLTEGPALQAIPPVEKEIPHHVNEVMGLLKLSDEELVEKMWPEPKAEVV